MDNKLEAEIRLVLSPQDTNHRNPVQIEPFHDEKHLHESRIIHVTFPFQTDGGSSLMVQQHQLDEMEILGFFFVSVDSDAKEGMKITFHKQSKEKNFTTI